jgi:hypothetical protein
MRATLIMAVFLSASLSACGGDETNSGTDTQNSPTFTIADGPASGLFADEAWEATRGVTDWLFGAALCSDSGSGCEPCEGKQLNFAVPDEPGTVLLAAGGPIVNFYDGGGANTNASTGMIVFESVDGDTITGGLFVSYPFSGKTYEVSGHFTIQNCD